MEAIFENKKNLVISSLALILVALFLVVCFLWLRLNNSIAERRYLSYLVGKQRILEKLLIQENKVLREKAHIPADRPVIVMEKKKASKRNRGFLFWKGTSKK